MDNYTKFILTFIAISILTLNIQLFKNESILVPNAYAEIDKWSYIQLMRNSDFNKAVRDIITKNCNTENGYIYC